MGLETDNELDVLNAWKCQNMGKTKTLGVSLKRRERKRRKKRERVKVSDHIGQYIYA